MRKEIYYKTTFIQKEHIIRLFDILGYSTYTSKREDYNYIGLDRDNIITGYTKDISLIEAKEIEKLDELIKILLNEGKKV